MVGIDVLQHLLIAIALGGLVGLEREYARYRKRGHDYAGIRTFPLIALTGGMAAYFGAEISPWILYITMLLVGLLIISAYLVLTRMDRQHTGATSEMAGFLTFFVGMLSYYGEINFAIALAVVMTIILYIRSVSHNFAKKINNEELVDTLKFVVIAFVILPFLPNQGYGPHEIFNPFIIWLMIVFISGISFVGYILLKSVGEKGIALAGILGGLISSTAVTTSFAQRSKREGKIYQALVLGVILANAIMFLRVLLEVLVINRDLFWSMIIPLLSLFIISLIFSWFIWEKSKKVKGKIQLGSPFTLGPALKFGAFFAVILALVKLADVYFSSRGVYVVSLISGFADVDAITVSLSQLAKGDLAPDIARNGIILATLTNVAVKGGIAYWFGRKEFGRLIALLFAVLIVIGILLLWIF